MSATPAAERRGSPGALAWRLLPLALFTTLTILTWKRWLLPFQDSGRDLLTASRLASGEVLYRDVGSPYGPLPEYLDAAALKLLGRDVDSLIALRLLVALVGVEGLRRLATRLAPDERVASAITSFIVAACCFGIGGAWPFPYSVTALEGTVATWWALELALSSQGWRRSLAAAVLAGFAGGTKIEMLPAALLALAPALLLRRPRREAFACVALAGLLGASAFAIPILLFGADTLQRYGFLIAFRLPASWQRMYRTSVLFRDTNPAEFLHGGFLDVWGPSLLLFGALVLLCRVRVAPARRALALGLLGVLVVRCFTPREEIAVLIPAAVLVALVAAVTLWSRRSAPDPTTVAGFCIAVAAGLALWRQPFFLRNPIYGAFSAPLGLAVSLCWMSRRVVARGAWAAFLVGLAAFHAWDRVSDDSRHPVVRLELPGVDIRVPEEEARFLRAVAAAVRRETPPGAYVAVFPDPGFVLFATGRRAPFVDDVFYTDCQDAVGEERMIERLRTAPVAAILVSNRGFGEYGKPGYRTGVLDRFFAEVDRRYRVAAVLGAPPRERFTSGAHATMGTLYLPKP